MVDHVALDADAETAVLAILLLQPERYAETASRLAAGDFALPANGRLYQAIGEAVVRDGTLDPFSIDADPTFIHEIFYGTPPAVSLLGRHVERVAHAAAHRRLIHLLSDTARSLQDIDADARTLLHQLADDAADCYPPSHSVDGYHLYDDWALQASESPRHWVIPGVLRRQGRMMIVASEGVGKSVLLRQIAVMAAAGLHPFRGGVFVDPINVLVVDLENDPATGMDEHATIDPASPLGLVITADNCAPDRQRTKLRVWARPDGINLRNTRDVAALERILSDFGPDLVTFGPLYKAYTKTKGEDDETLSGALQTVLDRLRITYDCAFIFEHHAPFERNRLRPFGSSLWLRWPDIGIGLQPDENDADTMQLVRFRGDRYKVDAIPTKIRRGRITWPWIPA